MKYDFIGIKKQGIYGINNPNLLVQFTTEVDNFDIKVVDFIF